MKRLLFCHIVLVSLLLCAGKASAQHFIGGSFSLTGSVTQSTSNVTVSTPVSLSIAPTFGLYLGERWAAGIRPTVRFGMSNANYQNKSFFLGLTPYARFRMLTFNRFGLWAEADPGISYQHNKYTLTEIGVTNTKEISSLEYGIQLLPVLTYQLTPRISLESRLNLFSLYLTGTHQVQSGGDYNDSFSYGLRATTQDVIDTLENLSIGFLYKF